MSLYLPIHTAYFQGVLNMLAPRIERTDFTAPEGTDLDADYFRNQTQRQQDEDVRALVQEKRHDYFQEKVGEYADWSKLRNAFVEGDVFELQRLIAEALRDGCEDDINEKQREYEREVYK